MTGPRKRATTGSPTLGPTRLVGEHGYTNEVCWQAGRVVKRYRGSDALDRLRVEVAALTWARGAVPVPPVLEVDEPSLTVTLDCVGGVHGQEVIDAGQAGAVLHGAGAMLRRFHDLPGRLVHGDYGPHNLLFDSRDPASPIVLDWEFAHDGDPVEDLAWAEWIVRMHHPQAVADLAALFDGYGRRPGWPDRQQAMIGNCERLRQRALREADQQAARVWQGRSAMTRTWRSGA
jgi:tRNA A-37 threonylcarbamoyl transferase component Bud32